MSKIMIGQVTNGLGGHRLESSFMLLTLVQLEGPKNT